MFTFTNKSMKFLTKIQPWQPFCTRLLYTNMSLFKSREFWKIDCDVDEKFDQNCLEVSELNGIYDRIIVGSHSGILRIYEPSTDIHLEDNTVIGYKPTDLLIEKLFSQPILQISTGKLVSGSVSSHIAILYPKSIAVYSLTTREGATEHGSQNILKLMYEHKFQRFSYNFTLGPFGGTQNRDFLCVQSLDGLLTFFEQESFGFCCFLPNFLLPGPLIYAQKFDSFVTVASNWNVESYKYKHLSDAGHNSKEEDSTGAKVRSDWDFNLGEAAVDMRYLMELNSKFKEGYICVLGERNYYCLNDVGKLKFMKKLEFTPICFFPYVLDEGKVMTLMISETNTLLIYECTTVKWSAQLSFLPISIRRAFLKNIKGAMVLLSEDGKLECCYLGTEPQLFTAPPISYQELDFDKAEEELDALNKIIRSYYADVKLTNTAAERELQVTVTVNSHLEACNLTTNSNFAADKSQMCLASVDLIPQTILEEVQLSVHVQKPLACSKRVEFYSNLTDKVKFDCYIYYGENFDVSNLDLEVIVSYISNLGVPRVIKKVALLPLKLVMETSSPSKESEHKITLNINQNPVPLTTLFPEFSGEDHHLSLSSNAVGFKNVHDIGAAVTILSAKNSQRYRLQSDSIVSLNIMAKQMIIRLIKHFTEVTDFKISYTAALPTEQILVFVRKHFIQRKRVNDLQNELSQLGGQFRIIQKRLISKFKDKHPTPLANLEILLKQTHKDIISCSTNLSLELDNLVYVQNQLSCALELLLALIKIMDLNKDVLPTLETAFSPAIYDLEGQNWEDTLDAALCFLLRTILSKSEKDKIKAAHSSFEEITDVTKVEKHITQVLDRLAKAEISEVQLDESAGESKEDRNDAAGLLPIGSRIGQSSSRILSAKRGLLRKHPIDN